MRRSVINSRTRALELAIEHERCPSDKRRQQPDDFGVLMWNSGREL